MKAVGSSQRRCFSARNLRAPLGRVPHLMFAVLVAAFIAPLAQLWAADSAGISDELLAKLNRRGDLTLSDTTLRQAMFTIAQSWDINLVVADEVDGKVNGVFKNAPLHEILHSILFANGFGYRVVGNGFVIMPLSILGDSNPLFQSATIVLRAVDPDELMSGAKLLSSPQGKVQAIPSARSLLVVDLPERVEAIRNFASQIDDAAARAAGGVADHVGQMQMAQFSPQYILAEWLLESVQAALSQDGKATVVKEENRLVVIDYPPALRLVDSMVRQLDAPRPQVRITALIYDVGLSDLNRLGINWNHALKGDITATGTADQRFAIDSLLQLPAAATDPSGVMTFMSLNRNFDLTAVIDALSTANDSQLLADPSIIVVDRETALIQIVTEIPYQQLTQSSLGGNIGTTAFRNAGVTLEVVPQIANDGTVLLAVTPSFSRLTGFTTGASPQPIIDKREAQTTVRVADRQTLVIGGLRQRTELNEFRGLPYLKDIRLLHLGKLFQARSTSVRESELVVFIHPQIITPLYGGTPREHANYHFGRSQLERIPLPVMNDLPYGAVIQDESDDLIEEVPRPSPPDANVLPLPLESSQRDSTRPAPTRIYHTAQRPTAAPGHPFAGQLRPPPGLQQSTGTSDKSDIRLQIQRMPAVENEFNPSILDRRVAAPPATSIAVPRQTVMAPAAKTEPTPQRASPAEPREASSWLRNVFRQ